MYNNDSNSLNAGAYANLPQQDIRLSGDHHPTNTQQNSGIMAAAPQTYTQRRRQQIAYGGIAGLDGRKAYGIGSWLQEKIKDPIAKLIPNELKNPLGIAAAATAANYLPKLWDGDTLLSRLPEGVTDVIDDLKTGAGTVYKGVTGKEFDLENLIPSITQSFKGGEEPGFLRQIANIGIPLEAGRRAYEYQKDYLARQPEFPMDDTGINFQTARQAMDDPNLRFKPKLEDTQLAAQGGRIGYAMGEGVESLPVDQMQGNGNMQMAVGDKQWIWDSTRDRFSQQEFGKDYHELNPDQTETIDIIIKMELGKKEMPRPDRMMAAEGGLMDLGGMEKDYRQEGGFVPIGGKEKADDVPARLSKNEFVFTADAVRAAGGGDIDQGAEVMENVMNNLEAGGEVSEDSQGLEGARGMFANAQELQKRII